MNYPAKSSAQTRMTMNQTLRTLVLPLLALLLSSAAQAQNNDEWQAKSDVALRKAAGDQQPAVTQVKALTPLTKTGPRTGPWTQVRTPAGQVGWVHMFDLQKPSGAAASAPPAGTGLMRTLTQAGKSASGSTTATTLAGIRGLDAEDIMKASPNAAAVAQAERRQVSADQARQFASAAKLSTREVDELPAPPLPSVTATQK